MCQTLFLYFVLYSFCCRSIFSRAFYVGEGFGHITSYFSRSKVPSFFLLHIVLAKLSISVEKYV